jgi:hypothetical protein
MNYTADFNQWRQAHYTQRLQEEKAKGNWKAVSYLRTELFNLKK